MIAFDSGGRSAELTASQVPRILSALPTPFLSSSPVPFLSPFWPQSCFPEVLPLQADRPSTRQASSAKSKPFIRSLLPQAIRNHFRSGPSYFREWPVLDRDACQTFLDEGNSSFVRGLPEFTSQDRRIQS